MRGTLACCLLALGGCAAEPTPPPTPPAEQQANQPGGWESAPTPNIRTERVPGRFAPPAARTELGWPDRYSGTPAGAPSRPRF